MSMIGSNDKLKQAAAGAAGGAEALAIEDVFSTYLYTGNGSTQTITNGIDLAGEGGLVWIKGRSLTYDHHLVDTVRGNTKLIFSNSPAGEATVTNRVTGFNSDGFSLGNNVSVNNNSQTYASWTFRKAPRFFDVVTYTGDGTSNRTISHNLGSVPGCIFVKNLTISRDWGVYHRGVDTTAPEDYFLRLNDTNARTNASTYWNDTAPTDTEFTLGSGLQVNGSGYEYVAYLFAHDPLGPSGDGSDGLIDCGSFTTDGSGNFSKEIGWEPQWIIYKRADGTSNWDMLDTMRGWTTEFKGERLRANLSNAAAAGSFIMTPTSTGFYGSDGGLDINATYIYIAIRRGPMRQPTSGTEVFVPTAAASFDPYTVGFPTDLFMAAIRGGSSLNFVTADRLRGETKYLVTSSTAAEATDSGGIAEFDLQNSFDQGLSISSQIRYNFRRAPGFFDVVAYTGDGASLGHNLAVTPELIIVKNRGTGSWRVTNAYSNGLLYLDANDASNGTGSFQTLTPCNEATMNLSGVSQSGDNIAYLFATRPGVSKVGSYTGNGTSQTINCGFTSGARFVLIKRTDSTGDWYVWDTERGIVAANDPHLSLNTTAAEVTTDDSVDPDATGFIVNQVAATNINVSSATYIFYAIA